MKRLFIFKSRTSGDRIEPAKALKKTILMTLIGPIVVLLLAEVILRYLGFDSPLLYVPDRNIGHLLAANQDITSFGNHIIINQYSMRGAEVSKTRSAGEFRVLMLGDSVLNGVWWTDQSQTISAKLQTALVSKMPSMRSIQVFNASAQGWAPQNELAYLQRFGTFDSNLLILVINTEDFLRNQPDPGSVGHDPRFFDHKPHFAIEVAAARYLLPNLPHFPTLQPSPQVEIATAQGDPTESCLAAIVQIHQIAQQKGIPMLLVLTPLKRELMESTHPDEQTSIDRLKQVLTDQAIPWINFLPHFKAISNPQRLYRDGIHLNTLGNQQVSDRISQQIQQQIQQQI